MPCENFKKITPLSCLEPNKLTTPGNFPSLETTKYLNTMKTTRKHLPFCLFLLVLVWGSSLVQAQIQSDTTYTGNIAVNTQAQVNALRNTLAGKTIIDGNVTIVGSDITDLAPLGSIVRITGYFSVSRNRELTDLGDFPVLQTIGGYFLVRNNDLLTDLGDFPVLQTIGGSFGVSRNRELTDLGDFSALQTIGESFNVNSNDSLTTLSNFPSLQSIGGRFEVGINSKLTDLGDFPVLQSIGGNFRVNSNSELTDLGDFPVLDSIGGYFSVSRNRELTDLGDFPVLQSIGGYFYVSDNDTLTDVGEFPVLQTIGGNFYVSGNDTLTDVGDFPVLQSIGGYFYVSDNDLTDLGDFPVLDSIGGYFSVRGNDQLRTLGDFSSLTSVGIGRVYVPSLGESRDSVSIVVESNPNLVLCSWVENFLPTGANAVTGHIYIQDNATGCATTEEIKNPPPVLLVAKDSLFVHKDSTTTSFTIYANVRWQLVTSNDATWITSLSSDSSTHTSRITGENKSTITLTHTRAPDETPRSTTLTLTVIDEEGNELTNPASITIHFTQLSTFYEGDIILSSQAEVNEFISNTTVILGTLTIGYTNCCSSLSDITDLSPLRNVVRITGNLIIQQNGQLDNLNALNNLQTVGGRFWVINNYQLTTLGNFPALQTIGGDFRSKGDFPALQTIGGDFRSNGDFPALQSIGGDFRISNGYFPVLETIGGDFKKQGNPELTDVGGFPLLKYIGGSFHVGGNRELTDVGRFPSLQTIGGGFSVWGNRELTDVGRFPSLQTIGGSFWVSSNIKLTNVGYFSSLQTIGVDFSVVYNDKLTYVGYFPVLQSIGGDFEVRDNDKLTDVGDFSVLDSIGGDFEVRDNDKLTDVGDFSVLDSIGGDFVMRNNDLLTDVGDFPSLQSIGGDFEVSAIYPDNSKLTDLGDFPSLQSIGGYFEVVGNRELTDVGDFPSLQSIGGRFEVRINSKLTDVGDFPVLKTIGGYFEVYSNRELTDLGDFPSLTSVGVEEVHVRSEGRTIDSVSIVVEYNPSLSDCCVLTDFFSNGANAVSGNIFINNNAMGCNSKSEINATTLTLTSSNESITHNDTDPIAIDFTVGCGASGWTSAIAYTPANANFITLSPTGGTNQTGAVTLHATPTENMNVERTATIRLSITGGTASQTVVITQAELPHTLSVSSTPSSTNGRINVSSLSTTVSISVDPGGRATGWTSTNTGSSFISLNSTRSTSTSATIVTARISGNLSTSSRSGTITFRSTGSGTSISRTITIMQSNPPHTLSVSSTPSSTNGRININSSSTTVSISVDPGGGATGWRISRNTGSRFMYLSRSSSSSTSATIVTATISGNLSTSSRSGTITFRSTGSGSSISKTITIMQRAAPPTLVISTSDQTINHNAGDFTITFDLGGGVIGWESSVTGAGFITLDPSMNTTSTRETVTITATPGLNDGLERKDTIIFTTTGGVADTVVITQEAAPPTLSLTSDSADTIAYNSTDDIDIMFNVGGGATGWTSKITYTPVDANFITRSSSEGTDQTGAVTITATPKVNTGIDERTATITLTTTGIGTPATQMIVIRQESKTLMVTTNKNHQIAYDNIDPISISFTVGGSATGWTSEITYTPVDANFITRSSSEGTDQRGAVTITATPKVNTGVERTATITLTTTGIGTPATQMIVIRQGEANITIFRETLIVTTNKNHQIAYNSTNPIPITFTVGGSATGWTSAITYTPANANFIALSPTRGTDITGAVTITATPKVNTGVERTATITLTTTGIGTPATQMIVIRQGEANITISRETLIVTTNKNHQIAYDNIDPISVSFTIGGGATGWTSAITYAPANADFIALSSTGGIDITGAITLMATPTVNTGVERTATITLTTTGIIGTVPVVQTIVIGQEANPTTLSTHTKESLFTLYPNPTESTLTIKGVTGYLQMYIYDLVGREVMTYSLTPSKKTIDVSDLPLGMYVVTLQGEEQTWTEVLIIVN